jgi:hypothetical protein
MLPRKEVLLKLRLTQMWKDKTIDKPQETLFKTMLHRERVLGKLGTEHEQILYSIEVKECDLTCTCKRDDVHPGFYLKIGATYRCKRMDQQMLKKLEKGILHQYVIFVDYEVPPEFQLTKALIIKRDLGHPISPEDYPTTKIQLKRLDMDENWFKSMFDLDDEISLSDDSEGEEINII